CARIRQSHPEGICPWGRARESGGVPLFVAEALFASVSGSQQNQPAGVCGFLSVLAQLSSADGVRAGRDDFVCGAGPGHCWQGQEGGFCQVSRPLQTATKPDKLSDPDKGVSRRRMWVST